MDTPTKIRKEIYDFVNSKQALTEVEKAWLSERIKTHSDCREINLKHMARRVDYTQTKISEYKKKAKKMIVINPRIQGNLEALELVLNWLNSDAE